jgi:hypothetical protein
MAALTPTKVQTISSPGGEYVIKQFTVTLESASDTVDLTSHFDDIKSVFGVLNEGQTANLATVHCTESAETVTIASLNAAGAASTVWTSSVVLLTVIGTVYPQ